jgi:hypothetical protein
MLRPGRLQEWIHRDWIRTPNLLIRRSRRTISANHHEWPLEAVGISDLARPSESTDHG